MWVGIGIIIVVLGMFFFVLVMFLCVLILKELVDYGVLVFLYFGEKFFGLFGFVVVVLVF